MSLITVYMTAGSREEADRIADCLVNERLVACVNILPPIQSVYRWQGEVCRDDEIALLAKTTSDRFEAVRTKVRELHSYDAPCVVAWPLAECDEAYANWLREAVE